MKSHLHSKIKLVSTKLEKVYGKKIWKVHSDPLSELIATILSQNTSDINSHRAYSGLRSRFKTWEQVRKAKTREIANAIRSGGLANIKAKRIKAILNQIYKEKGVLNLNFLQGWSTERIREYLGLFTGVGEKTIACVLLFSLKRPALPVDTHVLRVTKWLGLVPLKVDARKAEIILEESVPSGWIYQFHLNLIEHGRNICKAANPLCRECVLFETCDYGKKRLKQ